MALTLAGSTSLPLLPTVKPKWLPDLTPKGPLFGFSRTLHFLGLSNHLGKSTNNGRMLNSEPLLVELDVDRMSMAVLTVLAVALLAALVPSFKAARAVIAPALAA